MILKRLPEKIITPTYYLPIFKYIIYVFFYYYILIYSIKLKLVII
jgi:hypothetical protein